MYIYTIAVPFEYEKKLSLYLLSLQYVNITVDPRAPPNVYPSKKNDTIALISVFAVVVVVMLVGAGIVIYVIKK